MDLKSSAAMLMFLSAAAAGAFLSERLVSRIRLLKACAEKLNVIAWQVQATAENADLLLRRELAAVFVKKGDFSRKKLAEAIKSSALSAHESAMLSNFVYNFGSSSINQELSAARALAAELLRIVQTNEQDIYKKSKLCLNCGVLLGAFFLIILL